MLTYIDSKVFNFLLEKVKNLQNSKRLIKLDDTVSLFFRYATVGVGDEFEELKFPVLSSNVVNESVISLVFDVAGLYNGYITEIDIFKSGKKYLMYIIPDRESNIIDGFKNLLVGMSSGVGKDHGAVRGLPKVSGKAQSGAGQCGEKSEWGAPLYV